LDERSQNVILGDEVANDDLGHWGTTDISRADHGDP